MTPRRERSSTDPVLRWLSDAGFRADGSVGGVTLLRSEARGSMLLVEVAEPQAAQVAVGDVRLGVLHPVVEVAFGRRVPPHPDIQADAHASTRLEDLDDGADRDVVALLESRGLPWLARAEDPRACLEDGLVADPFVALELASLVWTLEEALPLVDAAKDATAAVPDAIERIAHEQRWRQAVGRFSDA